MRIGVSWCSVEKEICDDLLVLVDDATLPASACKSGNALVPIKTTVSDAPSKLYNFIFLYISKVTVITQPYYLGHMNY